MIISANWLKKFTNIDLPVDQLATLIGARLVEIEEIIDLGEKYKDVIVARVVYSRLLEGSDHLNVTKLDDGGVVKDVERDENGWVQVLCGAPNVRAGLTVAWVPPGATVPETYGKTDPFVLETRTIRGQKSNGMIASSHELDLSDDHNGILELDDALPAGNYLKDTLELDDYLLDIENKSLTHRPDAFGVIGFAREVAGIQGKAFTTPEWLTKTDVDIAVSQPDATKTLAVKIDNSELSDRYQATILANVDSKAASPLPMQTYLARVGMRPICAVVDVTNYLMLLTGQPLHAFDYDKVVAVGGGKADIHVRAAKSGETLKLLDGRTINLHPDDVVIAAGDTPVALAGAMGGADTEIDANTKTIILESATFNLFNLRATQMRHGIFSEAITRFTKGQPAPLTAPVLQEAVRMLGAYTGAKAISPVAEAYPGRSAPAAITLSAKQVNQTLGTNLTIEDMLQTLKNVEFEVRGAPKPKRVIVLHGRSKNPSQAWYPWLKEECEKNGIECIVPPMPHPDTPILKEWLKVLDDLAPDTDTVLVGHSRGGMAILRWLEQAFESTKVKKVVLVAANNPEIMDGFGGDFYDKPDYDFAKIKQHCEQFIVFHSDDDDFVPIVSGEKNAVGLNATFHPYHGLQHFGNNITRMQEIYDEVIDKDLIVVMPPYWRGDIHIPEDIIEEIGRLNGFDTIEPTLPERDFTAVNCDAFDDLRSSLRQLLVRAGANEVLTYSFVHGDMLTKASQKVDGSYRITNSISPNLQYYRQSLTPSLLNIVHPNIKAGYDQFALFELNKAHPKARGLTEEGVPKETDMLGLTIAGKQPLAGAPYYHAKKYVDFLMSSLGVEATCTPLESDPNTPLAAPFEYRRSALVIAKKTGAMLGIVGEYKKSVMRAFKLSAYTAGFELDTREVFKASEQAAQKYRPLSRYPGTERDICFKVGNDVLYQQIVDAATDALLNYGLEHAITPVDIYQSGETATKNITIRITLTSHEKTLTAAEVGEVVDTIATAVGTQTHAVVV